jgi:erythromycin esterase
VTTRHTSEAARQWIDAHAHELATTDPSDPLTDLAPLAKLLADARIVGIGESTRAGHEVALLGHRVLRVLVEELGFRTLALLDDEAAVATVDAYLRTGDGDPREALAQLWRPWRDEEMLDVVEWARSFNRDHPDDPVGMVGLEPASAQPADYRAVLDYVSTVDGPVAELRRHYDTIRTAHEVGEHVQSSRGTHPGRPFVEHARDAYDLVAALPGSAGVLDKAQRIVDFHARSFAAGGVDLGAIQRRAVTVLTTMLADPGTKIAYWDGLALTANAAKLEVTLLSEPFDTIGHELRRRLGAGYFSLLIGFGEGELGDLHAGLRAPAPMAGSADAELAAAGPDRYLLDLHAPHSDLVAHWLHGPHRLRIIPGIYDPAADAEHYVLTGALDEWFDALLHVRTITPTTLL